MSEGSLLLDLSAVSGCYYAPAGNYYGVGRVLIGYASGLQTHFGARLGLCSALYPAEGWLFLEREFPDLLENYIEPKPSSWERKAIRWVDMGDPAGGIRNDPWSKLRRKFWRAYVNECRWRLSEKVRETYRHARLLHAELRTKATARCPAAKRLHTVHDLIPIRDNPPDSAVRQEFEWLLRAAERSGAHFTCYSESSANDLMEFLGISRDRIHLTSLAVDKAFRPVEDAVSLASWRQRLGLLGDDRYVLAHTGQFKRKNIAGIVRVMELVRRTGAPQVKLVFAGYPKRIEQELDESVGDSVAWREFVRFTGSLDDGDFPVLYSGAELMLFLSWAEGFGLPPLEAMACGCPVVATNRTSVPEVVEDAALQVDPADEEVCAEAVLSLLTSPSLRREFAQRGLERARHFSWERVGERVSAAWETVLAD